MISPAKAIIAKCDGMRIRLWAKYGMPRKFPAAFEAIKFIVRRHVANHPTIVRPYVVRFVSEGGRQ
jgi:hypothetical protein